MKQNSKTDRLWLISFLNLTMQCKIKICIQNIAITLYLNFKVNITYAEKSNLVFCVIKR